MKSARQRNVFEFEYKKAIEVERLRLEHERVVRNSSEFNESRVSSVVVDTSAYKQEKLRIPKFENKQLNNVAKYLEVFESVVKQNGYEEEMWPLSLRTAVTGPKLEEIVELGGSYADIRNEILHAYGQTAEEVWKNLLTMKQGGESFRQFCLRVQRHLERFERLAMQADCSLTETLVKYFVLESCSADMRTFLIEHKVSALTVKDFQDLGVSYQDAHGRPGKKVHMEKGSKGHSHSNESLSTTRVWKVAAEDVMTKLQAMHITKCREFAMEKRLCFNCCKPGHRSSVCRAKSRCSICGKKHHSLLHVSETETQQVSILSSSVQTVATSTLLMTAVVEVKANAEELERVRVRVFLDPGAQVSFVSSELVTAIGAPQVGVSRISIKGFGSSPHVNAPLRSLTLVRVDGKLLEILALERQNLDLDIPRLPSEVVMRWKNRGVNVSDGNTEQVSKTIHVLVGADFVNNILQEKIVVDNEVAWRTKLGWVLCGPCKNNDEQQAQRRTANAAVAFVKADIERL